VNGRMTLSSRGQSLLVASLAGLAASLVLGACGGGNDNNNNASTTSTSTSTSTSASSAVNDHGSKDFSGKSEGDVELDDFYFKPTTVQGKPGQSVKLSLENEGTTEHNFSLPQQGIDQDVEKGKKASVTVKLPKSGRLTFFCKYHRSKGMVGALAVAGSSGGSASSSSGGTSTQSGGGGGGY
jgi:plastocyanin